MFNDETRKQLSRRVATEVIGVLDVSGALKGDVDPRALDVISILIEGHALNCEAKLLRQMRTEMLDRVTV